MLEGTVLGNLWRASGGEKSTAPVAKTRSRCYASAGGEFRHDPASECVSSVEGVEGNVSVCIARLSIRSENHLKSSTEPLQDRNAFKIRV